MRRKHEVINGHNVSCWDSGPKYADRYTVADLDSGEWCNPGNVACLSMSADPFWPQGIGQSGEMPLDAVAYEGRGGAFKKRLQFSELPADCQKLALEWLEM